MGVGQSCVVKPYLPSAQVINRRDGDDLVCSVCNGILWRPVTCGTCEKSFCEKCLRRLISKGCKCGDNDTPCVEGECSRRVIRRLSRLQITCKYKSNGCSVVVKYDSYGSLVQHQKKCDYQLVECPSCEKNVIQKDLNQHIQNCPMVSVTCGHCHTSFLRQDEQAHSTAICIEVKFHIEQCKCKKLRSNFDDIEWTQKFLKIQQNDQSFSSQRTFISIKS
jgi:hypothetical protein